MITQLYSSPFNEDKKLLAFSDSVQDASHRSGFFAARTYTFTLRGAIQKIAQAADGPVDFVALQRRFLAYWRERMTENELIATFLPPDLDWLEDYEALRRSGELPRGNNLPQLLERRLGWEIWTEYTLDCRIGRTLEKTGCSTLEVKPEIWARASEHLWKELREQIGSLREVEHENIERFLAGLVQNLKNRGGVRTETLEPFIESLGNWWLLSKQHGRAVWRPNFSGYSRAPVFLTSQAGERFQTLVRQKMSTTATWYEGWLEKSFHEVDPQIAAYGYDIYQLVLRVLVEAGLLFKVDVKNAAVWGLDPAALQVTTEVRQFRCGRCSFAVSVSSSEKEGFAGTRCMRRNCDGSFDEVSSGEDYYRRLYQSGHVQRIFAAEHTGLLDRDVRERVEEGFRANERPGDPNLLSCTPTLEMGINIGDLSSLALCSVPPKPSNYLQRVGRAGRVDGNSFVLTVANARPHDLFFFFEPEEMIQGLVETPGCFLNAAAVLERQFTAFLFDRWVESGIAESALSNELRPVLDVVETGKKSQGFPANLLAFFDKNRTELEDAFLALFGDEMADYTRDRIRAFSHGNDLDVKGLEQTIWDGLDSIAQERKSLRNRIQTTTKRIRAMKDETARDKDHEETLQELIREKAAINAIVRSINEKKVLNFFTDEGLLPNYAFPESGIVLRSVIYRRNQKAKDDESRYTTQAYEYERPAESAILELAPANRFYAEGRRLEIDQVNLQLSKPEAWRFCSACSYLELEGVSELRASCPQCGSPIWSDEGQRRQMLRMRQVISTSSEQRSRSYDESDDREPQFYQKNMFVVKDDDNITEAYFIDQEEVPFGFEFFRKIKLVEVNFGDRAVGGGTTDDRGAHDR